MTSVHFTDTTSVGTANRYVEPLKSPLKLLTSLTVVEMHPWRASRYRTNRTHQNAYRRLIEPSAPEEDHDDRNALYGMYVKSFIFFHELPIQVFLNL